MSARQSFGVFVERLDRLEALAPSPPRRPGEPAESRTLARLGELWLELPGDPARLSVEEGRVVLEPLAVGERGLVFETIRHEQRPYLAMLTPGGGEVRVNGAIPPPAAILRVRDQVEIDGRAILHVSQFTRPFHGPAGEEHVGNDCPVCLTPIVAGKLVFVCFNCQRAMHAYGEETAADDRLECHLSTSTCPSCNMPLVREEGFAYVPDI